MSYDGQNFLDDSGAVHDVSLLADGDAIPGTHWVKLDAQRVKTKGGLVHHFNADSHRLLAITGVDGVRRLWSSLARWQRPGGCGRRR